MPHNPLINSLLRQNPGSRTVLDIPEEDDLDIQEFLDRDAAGSESFVGPRTDEWDVLSRYKTPTNPSGDPATFNDRARWAGTHESAQQFNNKRIKVPPQSTEERLFNAIRAGNTPKDVSALQFLLGREDDVAGRDATLKAQTAAKLGGFGSPQEMAGWQREFEMGKARMPLDVARTTGQFGVDEARVRGETAVNQARTQGEYGLKREELIQGTKQGALNQLGNLFSPQGAGNERSRTISIPGVVSMSQGAERLDAAVPAALQTNLMNARRLVAQRPDDASAQAALSQAIANIVQSAPVTDTTRQWAHTIASDPRLAAMPLDQIISLHESKTGDVLEANEIAELRNLMSQLLVGQQQ